MYRGKIASTVRGEASTVKVAATICRLVGIKGEDEGFAILRGIEVATLFGSSRAIRRSWRLRRGGA
jgi:hypothetical protein